MIRLFTLAGVLSLMAAWPATASADANATCERVIGGTVEKNKCIVTASRALPRMAKPLVTYPVLVTRSDVTLDCNDNTLVPKSDLKPAGGYYIGIDVRGKNLANVTVTRCRLSGFDISARVSASVPGKVAKAAIKSEQLDRAFGYSPRKVVFDRLVSINAVQIGFNFAGWVEGATLRNSKIQDTGGPAVYLSAHTRRNRIIGNRFVRNGHVRDREILSIDASAENIIENNEFRNGKLGGIFLYKNCQEHASKLGGVVDPRFNESSAPRVLHAKSNVIRDNVFAAMPIGVHVASRQSADQFIRFCGDPSPYPFPLNQRYWLDFAENTLIEGNDFVNLDTAIIVEDDNARIVDNEFTGNRKDILVGTRLRQEHLNRPVGGTTILRNTFGQADLDRAVDIIYGSRNTIFQGRTCPEGLPSKPGKGGAIVCAPTGTRVARETSGRVEPARSEASEAPRRTRQAHAAEPPNRAKSAIIKESGCSVSGNNDGCEETYACPSGYVVNRIRAACHLELNRKVDLPEWGDIDVVVPSGNLNEGLCRAGDTAISSGRGIILFSQGPVRLGCIEHDKNGGDCAIRAEIECVRAR